MKQKKSLKTTRRMKKGSKKGGGGVTCTMVGETLDLFHAFYSRDFFFFKKQFLARLWTSNHKLAANVLFKHWRRRLAAARAAAAGAAAFKNFKDASRVERKNYERWKKEMGGGGIFTQCWRSGRSKLIRTDGNLGLELVAVISDQWKRLPWVTASIAP